MLNLQTDWIAKLAGEEPELAKFPADFPVLLRGPSAQCGRPPVLVVAAARDSQRTPGGRIGRSAARCAASWAITRNSLSSH